MCHNVPAVTETGEDGSRCGPPNWESRQEGQSGGEKGNFIRVTTGLFGVQVQVMICAHQQFFLYLLLSLLLLSFCQQKDMEASS